MEVRIVKCTSCTYMANLDEATNLKWVTSDCKKYVVCPGNGRKACGAYLKPETFEPKGLKRLRTRKRS